MDTSRLSDKLQRFFLQEAEIMGRVTFFVRRTSKLTASLMLRGLVFGWLANPLASLNDLAAFFQDRLAVPVTSQGLHARIHRYTVAFFKKMCQMALMDLSQTVQVPIPVLRQFPEVNVTDSTGISLPACLKTRWPGSGGKASPAGLKIQLVFEFLTGTFKKVWVTNGITPDQAITRHISGIQRGSLNLFDLAYFSIARLRAIRDKGAFFLCRFLPSTTVYDTAGQKLDLVAFLRQETRDRFEMAVQIGRLLPIACRLCCFRAPEAVVNRRRWQAKRKAKKQGRTPTKQTLYLLGWTILITNVSVSRLDLNHVARLYSLRWQVELVFKLWKSQMQVDHIAGLRKERVQVELYAKLIGLVLFRCLAMPLRSEIVDLSPGKALTRVAEYSGRLSEQMASESRLTVLIDSLHNVLRSFATRDRRKTHITTVQHLLVGGDTYA